MPSLETIRVQLLSSKNWIVINQKDYDPNIHLWEDALREVHNAEVTTDADASTNDADADSDASADASTQLDLRTVVLGLDQNNDEHWTASGTPAMAAVEAVYGEVTRNQVEEVAADISRFNIAGIRDAELNS
jgi:hypothetical protein